MDTARFLLLVSLLTTAGVGHVKAQGEAGSLQLTPSIGAFLSHASSADLPAVNGDGVVEAAVTSSPLLAADVEVQLPLAFLSLRGGFGAAVFSSVEFVNWDGEYSRGSRHVSFGNPQGIGSSVWLLSGSVVFKPGTGSSVPYLVGGMGIKHYNYANMAAELEEVLSSNSTRASFHVGLGLPVGRRFRIEVGDHISRQNFVFEVPQMVRLQEPEQTQHDIIITIGYRFDLR